MPFGSSRLIQTDDFYQTGLLLSAGPTSSTGAQPLTGCTGTETMQDLTFGKAANGAYADGNWRGAVTTTALTESVSRAVTTTTATQHVAQLADRLTGCRYRRHGRSLQLGTPTALRQHGGRALIYLSSDAHGTAYGGVAVFRNGKNFGVLELTDAQVDRVADADLMQTLAVAALSRVKDPG